MKKLITLSILFITLVAAFGPVQAQMARKQPALEHFTNASCPPCAAQNPIFEPVREAFYGVANHVAYHTDFPGFDPMYNANPTEADQAQAFYSISAVPSMIMDGSYFGGPASVGESNLDDAVFPGSPIRVRVEETTGTSRNVTVYVDGFNTAPAGSYVLKLMVVEDPKDYATAPGSNGEKNFPNVFRQYIGGSSGTSLTLPASGATNTYNFSYSVDGSWNAANTFVVAYVQNSSTREILNSSTSRAPNFDFSLGNSPRFSPGGSGIEFLTQLEQLGSGSENITITLTAEQPSTGGWTASFDFNGNNYTTTATATVNAGDLKEIKLNVTSGTTSGIGVYTIGVRSNDHPEFAEQKWQFYVVHDVTDLVVTNLEFYGDGAAPGSLETEAIYTDGLEIAGRETRAEASHFTFRRGMDAGALDGVLNVYYNVSWTFPSATPEKVAALEAFLDRGGNLFISAQDFGWEIMDASSPFRNIDSRLFYLNYLEADYNADGSSATTSLTFDTADPWIGTAGTTNINPIYGSANVYPDEIGSNGPEATTILYYNGSAAKTGGIRTEKDGYKVVYLGTGIEMFSNRDVAEAVVKLAHDYFWDGVSGLEFDALLASTLLGQNIPNPAAGTTAVPLYDWNAYGTLEVVDLQGRTVAQVAVAPGQQRVDLDLSRVAPGVYAYFLTDGERRTEARKLTILR